MRFEIAPLYILGKRRPAKDMRSAERITTDLHIDHWPSTPLGRPAVVAHIFKTTPAAPDKLPPLYDAQIEGMAQLAFTVSGFELVDGVLYRQEWHCRELRDKYEVPWTACPRSALDELI